MKKKVKVLYCILRPGVDQYVKLTHFSHITLGLLNQSERLEVTYLAPKEKRKIIENCIFIESDGSKNILSKARQFRVFLKSIITNGSNFDVIVLILPTPAQSFMSNIVKGKLPDKKIITFFNSSLHKANDVLHPKTLKYYGYKPFLRYLACNHFLLPRKKKSDKYIVATDYQKRELIKHGFPEKKVEVLQSIPFTGKLTKHNKTEAREHYGIDDDVFIVGYSGHFNYGKGIEYFIEAVKKSKIDVNRLFLISFSGTGNERLFSEISNRKDVKVIPKTHIDLYLSAVDCLVLPYTTSSGTQIIPFTLLEAIYINVPVIVSDLDYLKDIFDGEVLFFRNRDADDMRDKINVIRQGSLMKEMMLKQKKFSDNNFDMDIFKERLEKLIVDRCM